MLTAVTPTVAMSGLEVITSLDIKAITAMFEMLKHPL